jgi:hypothetical protein
VTIVTYQLLVPAGAGTCAGCHLFNSSGDCPLWGPLLLRGDVPIRHWKCLESANVQVDVVTRLSEQSARIERLEGLLRRAVDEPWSKELADEARAELGKPAGVAGDKCESGNECGRMGCPNCQQ